MLPDVPLVPLMPVVPDVLPLVPVVPLMLVPVAPLVEMLVTRSLPALSVIHITVTGSPGFSVVVSTRALSSSFIEWFLPLESVTTIFLPALYDLTVPESVCISPGCALVDDWDACDCACRARI